MPQHKHLIIRAEVNDPIKSEKECKKWLRNLIKVIEMKIIKGPYASYVSKEGNRGITGVVMIETSHAAIHVWDEVNPALVQFDVYSCADFLIQDVLFQFKEMNPSKIEWKFMDRSEGLKILNTNSLQSGRGGYTRMRTSEIHTDNT